MRSINANDIGLRRTSVVDASDIANKDSCAIDNFDWQIVEFRDFLGSVVERNDILSASYFLGSHGGNQVLVRQGSNDIGSRNL